MSIKNTQIEEKAKKLPAEEPANPGPGNGVWYADTVLGTTEGFYKDSSGAVVQVTKQGGLNVPPFAYNLTVKEEGTTVDANVNELNFVGTGVTATQTAAGKINVTVTPGETNTGSNVGTGQGHVFKQKTGVNFEHRTIKAGSNISVVETANEIEISTAAPSGEANTASNVGGGNGVFKQKSGVDLQFRTILAGTNVSITSATDTITINSTGGGGGGSLSAKDEGSIVDSAVVGMDFVGAGVTTTQTSSGQVQVSIPGTTNVTVRDEGSNITTTANTLNFTGAGVTASLASPGIVNVAISGSGTNISVKDEGTTVESALTSINFVGAGVTATSSSGTATITIPSGSGETNTASNVGSGSGVFKQKTGVDLQFKSLVAGSNVTITPGTNDITIAATAGSGMDTATVRFASNKILVRASGSTAALAAITATKSFSVANTCTVTLGGLTGVVLHSVLVRFTAAETTGRAVVELVYPEPFGATDLYQSVRPLSTRLNAADAASSMTANAANSSGTMTITCTGYTAAQDYGAIFSF